MTLQLYGGAEPTPPPIPTVTVSSLKLGVFSLQTKSVLYWNFHMPINFYFADARKASATFLKSRKSENNVFEIFLTRKHTHTHTQTHDYKDHLEPYILVCMTAGPLLVVSSTAMTLVNIEG